MEADDSASSLRSESPTTPISEEGSNHSTLRVDGRAKSAAKKVGAGARKAGAKAGSGARKVGSGAKLVGAKAGSGAKMVGAKAGSGARKVGSGAKLVGVGAARLATAPGKRVKSGMDNLNERMVEVEWTPGVMVKEYVRFNLTGIVNTTLFLILYELLYWLNLWDDHRAVSAWVVSAMISQVQSHFTHYRFTFASQAPYLQSLKWAMIVYSTALILSTTSEYYLIEVVGIYHRIAWVINALFFGFMNFAALRWLAFPPEFDKSMLSAEE